MNGVFPDWLNANSGRAYPLAENASRMSTSGGVVIPDSLIVAAQINMLPAYATGTFFIKEVSVSAAVISVVVGFKPETGDARQVGRIVIPVSSHSLNTSYAFVGQGEDSSVIGSLTIGSLTDTLNEVPGVVGFDPIATPFEVSALFISSPALEAVEIYNGGSLLDRFSRVLKLRAGENIRLSLVDDDPNVIRIDAIPGENLIEPDQCENAVPLPPCIRTINGQPPDENGNFTIDGGKCIDVQATPGLIVLKDLCSQSCCGCSELEALVAGLSSLETQIASLRTQISSVVGQQTQMLSNLVSNLQ